MTTSHSLDVLASRVVAAIASANIAPALLTSSEDSYDSYWSIIARHAGQTLHIHPSNEPTTFAAMQWAKPQVTVSIGTLSRPEVVRLLRRAAFGLALPEDARAIPFSLLTGGSAHHAADRQICGVAFRAGLDARVVVKGHGLDASLQAVVIGNDEVAVVGLDSNSARFGTVTLRRNVRELTRADVDQEYLSLQFTDSEMQWRLESTSLDETDAAIALFTQRGVPVRRLVETAPNTRAWSDA